MQKANIMRKLTIALVALYSFTSTNDFFLIKQRKCQLLSLNLNTGLYFFLVCLFFAGI